MILFLLLPNDPLRFSNCFLSTLWKNPGDDDAQLPFVAARRKLPLITFHHMSKSTSIESVARMAGVAKSTVSLALRDSPKLPEQTRLKIKKISQELRYRPNPLVSAQMAQIRRSNPPKTVTTIGFLNTWVDAIRKKRLKWESMGRYYRGAKQRAEKLGFHFQPLEFDLNLYSGKRIEQILEHRKIDGLILPPLPRSTTELEIDWSPYAVASIGNFAALGNIHRVSYDNFNCMKEVMEITQERGYKRIGFITNLEDEERAGHLWSAGYLEFQSRNISIDAQVPLLRLNSQEMESASEEYRQIKRWYYAYKPDLILSYQDNTLRFLESIGLRSPEDFGYVSLIWSKNMGDISGYCQDLERVGEIAVNIVVDRLLRNRRGEPDYPFSIFVIGKFIEGRTLRPRSK
ncbi:MAG: LacI family DNA-binding transcriptional regulator [Opitutae bacterium]|nr:LacI family DNA-binding transcriptional regulator [Opitutae bacterium]